MVHQCIVLTEGPGALVEVCGVSVLERLLRTLQRCGFRRAIILSSAPELLGEDISRSSWARPNLTVTVYKSSSEAATARDIAQVWPEGQPALLLVKGDAVLDIRLLRLLAGQKETAGLVDSAVPTDIAPLVASTPSANRGKFAGVALIQDEWAKKQNGPVESALLSGLEQNTIMAIDVANLPVYSASLRREMRPFWFPAPSSSTKATAERILLNAAQKGALDIPAWVHAPIERFFISYLCRTPVTPNQLTIACNVVAWITTALLATGHLNWGIGLALIVGILDGLDGKQARVKMETTKGGKIEHWFDGLFEWSWWIALAFHFRLSGELPQAFIYLSLLILGEGLDAVAKGMILFKTGRIIDELGAFERAVRLIGGRRNVYIWILAIALLLGAPAKGFVTMAWLEIATAAAHLPRAAWAWWRLPERRRAVSLD
jgi:phosphatidylglycerophosphate synthase